MPPRILYFKDVAGYIWEAHGIKVHPLAAYNWIRYKGVSGRRWNGHILNHTRMGISGRSMPLLVTTAKNVDEFLKLRKLI